MTARIECDASFCGMFASNVPVAAATTAIAGASLARWKNSDGAT